MVAKGVFEDQAGARWYFLVREHLRAQCQHVFDGRQAQVFDEEADIIRIDIASRPTGVISQRHRRATENVKIPDNAATGQPGAEPTEGILDGGSIE